MQQQRCVPTFWPSPKGKLPRDEADMDRSSHGSCSENTSPPLEKHPRWVPKIWKSFQYLRDIQEWDESKYPTTFEAEKSGSVFFSGEKGENPPPLMPINAFFKAQVTAAQIRGAAWCFCGPGSLGLRCHKGVGPTSTGINRATRLPNIPALSVECREAKRRRTKKPRWQAVPPVTVLKEDGLL